jgi:hypothetical protein
MTLIVSWFRFMEVRLMADKTWQQERKESEAAAREQNRRSGRVQTPDGPGTVLARTRVKNTNGGPGSNKYCVQLDDGRKRNYSPHALTPLQNPVR